MKTIKIYQDSMDWSPKDWDNLGTIAYKHSRYSLGEEVIGDPVDWLTDKIGLTPDYVDKLAAKQGYRHYSNETREMLEAMFLEKFIALPLYLYDHSGITISTTPFHCPWDSGQVGYIYVTKEKARRELGIKRITSKKRILDYLRGEIETFDQYLRGDVYGFRVFEHEPDENPEDGEEIDACWGFYGTDWENNGVLEYIDLPDALEQLEGIEIEY